MFLTFMKKSVLQKIGALIVTSCTRKILVCDVKFYYKNTSKICNVTFNLIKIKEIYMGHSFSHCNYKNIFP